MHLMAARYCPLNINIFFLTSCSTIACSSESCFSLSTAGPVPITLPVWVLCRQRASSTLKHISLGLHPLHRSHWPVLTYEGLLCAVRRKLSFIEIAGFRVVGLIWYFFILPLKLIKQRFIFSASCIRNTTIGTLFHFQWPFVYIFFIKYHINSQRY